ncbi:hypothetical protein GCG54_00007027 [Colletotrichum gloeosporioides]|uniref:Acyltransferase 3 domain-containing protein n=1 Tax=Colletotrichum gloeosporioides TaxID=474922 RepID=A0A8H4CBK0_COLGL|nr:uncharacterized protein GCG54_00007027 [Colletotrichum gloeosporioides]KAF3800768.1 hypothetical protein GCG54_00007027 [Colletotrichum gloeosporioides]
MYKTSLETIRGWFSTSQSGDSYILLENGETNSSTELPINEIKQRHHKQRYCSGWRPKDALQIFWAVLPSFFARALGHEDEASVIPPANDTSYLNGLRGLAALFVVIYHNTNDYSFMYHGWGEAEEYRHPIQLPFIRLIYGGYFSVSVFFVISGFALTYGPLKKSHHGQSEAAIGSLPSSIFRRPIRLFLPVVPVLIMVVILIQLQGLYNGNGLIPPIPGGVWGQAVFIWRTMVIIVTQSTTNTILPQAWTLSAEYQGSLLVFLCCMAFARASPRVRLPLLTTLLAFLFSLGFWQHTLFLAGMLLADFRHVRNNFPELSRPARWTTAFICWLIFFLSLFLGGWPMLGDGYAAAGYSWFRWVPTGGYDPTRFFATISAIGLVASLEGLSIPRRGLNARWILYLGEISYGLYLVHWTVSSSFMTWGVKLSLLAAGHSQGLSWGIGFGLAMTFCIWLGDVQWRLVDRNSVKFARWLSEKCGI